MFPERLLGLVLVDHGGDPRNDSEADLAALVNGLSPEAFEESIAEDGKSLPELQECV